LSNSQLYIKTTAWFNNSNWKGYKIAVFGGVFGCGSNFERETV
jgi:hypothetical protein